MISRKNRFHGHASLRYVYSQGQVVRGPMISLKFTQNPKRSSYRLAVVISKKVLKSAVDRNRLRRQIYEQVRLLEPAITEPYDLVVTVFNEQIMNLGQGELATMVAAQLRQAGVLQEPKVTKS